VRIGSVEEELGRSLFQFAKAEVHMQSLDALSPVKLLTVSKTLLSC
jgi:hypothetical protein